MEQEKTVGRLPEIVRIGGYLIAGGALIGFSASLYLLLNRVLFSLILQIGQPEIMIYFLSVLMPSFVGLIVTGYLFATTLRLKKTDLSGTMPLIVLSLFSLILSGITIFYFISFLGAFLTLIALLKAYAKPSFKTFAHREAFFLLELGALFVTSFSLLFLSMGILNSMFETYALGSFASFSAYALLSVAALSLFMFLVIPRWGSGGMSAGISGGLGLVMSVLSYLFVVQNRYVLFNASAHLGMLLLVGGFISALIGELLYLKLFFFEPSVSFSVPASSILYGGQYCPYCGKPRQTVVQKVCSSCGRDLMWTPYVPFCTSCGRLVSANIDACPHCREDIRNKRSYFQQSIASEKAIVDKLEAESRKMETWHIKTLTRITSVMRRYLRIAKLRSTLDRLNLTLKETVVILILTYLFGFVSFISYKRPEYTKLGTYDIAIHSYGLPFECLKVRTWLRPIFVYDIIILWIPLLADIFLYFMAAFALVYGIARWRR
jgi:hypothetical protein